MSDLTILIVEDENEVRQAIGRDLAPFVGPFRLEYAEDAEDARLALADTQARGERVALVLCDHLLPGERGTDFLIALHGDSETRAIKKVLITGQAGHEDTIRAINEADLNHYIAKPWDPRDLQSVVRDLLTDWVLDEVKDVLPYVQVLDGPRLLDRMTKRAWDR